MRDFGVTSVCRCLTALENTTNQSIIIMKTIKNSKDAYDVIKELVKHPEQEELFMICLSRANGVKDIHFIGLGTDVSVCVSQKIIARQAVLDLACGVILVHTHPSGVSTPSVADIEQTEAVRNALKYFDIALMDHIIIGKNQFFSFSDDSVTEV